MFYSTKIMVGERIVRGTKKINFYKVRILSSELSSLCREQAVFFPLDLTILHTRSLHSEMGKNRNAWGTPKCWVSEKLFSNHNPEALFG
jgi:hypothetical protein